VILARLNAAFALTLLPAPASVVGTPPFVCKWYGVKPSASITDGLKPGKNCKTVCEELRISSHPQNKYMYI